MAKKLFLIIIFCCFSSAGYAQFHPPMMKKICRIETNLVQIDKNNFYLYLSSKIAYSELIFSKEDSAYVSGVEFSCELSENDKISERLSSRQNVKVYSFEETLRNDKFLESVIRFKLGYSNYSLQPFLLRSTTNQAIPLEEFKFDNLKILSEKRVNPIITRFSNERNVFLLVNEGNLIPFNGEDKYIFVPVPDSIKTGSIKLQQKDKTLKDTLITSLPKYSIEINKEGTQLRADRNINPNSPFTYIRIKVPVDVQEGELLVLLEDGKKNIWPVPVVWIDKPFILDDLDLSIKLLRIIENEQKAASLLQQPSDEKYLSLLKEWNEITHLNSSGYNEYMNEFYSRADYAIKNFSYGNKLNGAESDRGTIYIKYGKPAKVERHYNDKNEIIEIWYYDEVKTEFIFEDTIGKGNYILRK